jgi:hypothetical protein
MSKINDDLLSVDPESQAVEVDDDVQYEPDTTSQVVATEPPIISIGRGKRSEHLRHLPKEQQ